MVSPFRRAFWTPRCWPVWPLLAAMRLCALLPFGLQLRIGAGLGRVAYRLLPSRRRVAATNIDLCFPDKTAPERKALVKHCFRNIGIAVTESALAWWGSDRRLRRLYTIEGYKYLEQAIAEDKPILLLSGHMSCSEIGARFLAFHLPFQAMYKPAKNPLYEHVMLKQRSRFYREMVPRKNSRRLLRNLKRGVATWYAPDQNFGREDTVFAPFFGVPATSLTATGRIAKATGAVVLPFFPLRLDGSRGYKLIIGRPLDDFPSDDSLEDATRINRIIESAVRLAPEQYLWVHKRFRIRPGGEAELY